MERAYMPPAVPPPLEHDAWGAPHPKAAVAGPPARTAGFDPIADHLSLNGDDGPCPKPDLPCGSEDRLDGVGDKLPMLALDLRAARLHEYSELRTAGEEPSVR
jgi:hypothetical protein